MKNFIKINAVLLLTILAFACNKAEKKPAKFVEGQYTGVATDADSNVYNNATVNVIMVENKKIRVESVSPYFFEPYEVEIMHLDEAILNNPFADFDYEVIFSLEDDPIIFGFANDDNGFKGEMR